MLYFAKKKLKGNFEYFAGEAHTAQLFLHRAENRFCCYLSSFIVFMNGEARTVLWPAHRAEDKFCCPLLCFLNGGARTVKWRVHRAEDKLNFDCFLLSSYPNGGARIV